MFTFALQFTDVKPIKTRIMNTTIFAGDKTKDFFVEVTKAYAENCGSNEIIRTHAPSTHGGTHEKHSQIMFIDRSIGQTTKVKLEE